VFDERGERSVYFKDPTFFKHVIMQCYYVYVVEKCEKMCCDIVCCVYRLVYLTIKRKYFLKHDCLLFCNLFVLYHYNCFNHVFVCVVTNIYVFLLC